MSSSVATKVGAIASVACIVHCTVLPLLLPLFPLLGIAVHNEWLELVMWLLACSTAVWHAYQHPGWFRYWCSIVAVLGTIGILTHHHELLHAAFYGVAAGSLWCLLRKKKQPCTCTHE